MKCITELYSRFNLESVRGLSVEDFDRDITKINEILESNFERTRVDLSFYEEVKLEYSQSKNPEVQKLLNRIKKEAKPDIFSKMPLYFTTFKAYVDENNLGLYNQEDRRSMIHLFSINVDSKYLLKTHYYPKYIIDIYFKFEDKLTNYGAGYQHALKSYISESLRSIVEDSISREYISVKEFGELLSIYDFSLKKDAILKKFRAIDISGKRVSGGKTFRSKKDIFLHFMMNFQ